MRDIIENLLALRINVRGAENILDAARRHNAKVVVAVRGLRQELVIDAVKATRGRSARLLERL